MNFVKRYIKLHIKFLLTLYRGFLLCLDKRAFATFYNLKSLLIFSPSRLTWDGKVFVVTDREVSNFKYTIRHQRQCNMAYEYGVKKRAKGLADCYFLNEIEFDDGDIFLDCGANVGDLKIWFDLNNIKINYVAFEPSPTEFDCLKENVKPCTVYNVGLWNEVGELEFFVSSQGADSSLIEPVSFDEKIKVPVDRLESYVNSTIKILKLEAEGAEPEILEGLGDKLSLIEYVSADLGYERGVKCESTLVPVTNYLLEYGFELVNVSHGRICALYKNTRM
jgi:FkbM family methyltransferase